MFIGRPFWEEPTTPLEALEFTWLLRPTIEIGLPNNAVNLFTYAKLLGTLSLPREVDLAYWCFAGMEPELPVRPVEEPPEPDVVYFKLVMSAWI